MSVSHPTLRPAPASAYRNAAAAPLSLDRMVEMARLSSQLLDASTELLNSILTISRDAIGVTHDMLTSFKDARGAPTNGADARQTGRGCDLPQARDVAKKTAQCNLEILALLGNTERLEWLGASAPRQQRPTIFALQDQMRTLGGQAASIAAAYSTAHIDVGYETEIGICAASITRMLLALRDNIAVAETAAKATEQLHCQTIIYVRLLENAASLPWHDDDQ